MPFLQVSDIFKTSITKKRWYFSSEFNLKTPGVSSNIIKQSEYKTTAYEIQFLLEIDINFWSEVHTKFDHP